MSKKNIYHFLFLVTLYLLSGCSTEKNTRLSRTYHNVTSHYNIYFNGKESLKEGLNRIDRAVEDDYTKLLPIYKSSDPSTGQAATSEMETAVLKASKLIKLHSITKKPKRKKRRTEVYKRFASKEEYNKWIDDGYLLMGQAYFYMKNYISAVENFSYVVRKFTEEDTKQEAYVWLIRSYTEMQRYNEALEIIQSIDADEDFPKKLNQDFALAVADFHIRLREYEEAIPYMKSALKGSFMDKNKARYKYILAQLYQETGNELLASETFREVARMNPPYIMAFNARINAAGTFTGDGDIEKLQKELRKMLRDDKNFEFRDQIYFALANIYMAENNKTLAIDHYIKSASASNVNVFQRALTCLTLADIYFEELNYKGAQSYYDSAMVVIDETYPNYKDIQDRYQSLTRLVENIYTVEREDSLQRIALLSDAERNQLVGQWIQQALDEEQRQRQLEANQMRNSSFFRMNQSRLGLSRNQQGAGWYFYNPTTVAYGKVEFEQIWGRRKLEDDWRRSVKGTASELELAELEAEEEGAEPKEKRVEDPKDKEYYLQDVPLTDEEMAESHNQIRDALFNAGRIFKQDYNNYERSIESYEELNKRYPGNIYELSAYFELWDLYKRVNNMDKANYYRNLVVTNFPESKYAKYLVNPNYFIELEARKDSLNNLYQQAFYNYKRGSYKEAGELVEQMKTMDPDSLILPKISFISAIAEGTQTDWQQFGRLLTAHVREFPKSETKPLAEEILHLIEDSTLADYQKLIEIGYLNETIQNEELQPENLAENDEFGGKFSYDEDLLHYFVIAYPRAAGLDINRLKFDIANYNIDHYTQIDFDIETQNLNNEMSLVVVRALEDKEQALIYFRSIIRKREVFETLQGIEYINFVTSSYNFREIVADQSYIEYLKFFIKNYSRFISSDFPDDELEDPEELMAKARDEEEKLEERGSFVVVKPDANKEVFEKDYDASQNFVIAVNDPNFDLRLLMTDFTNFNRERFADENLTMQQRMSGGYKLLVVKSMSDIRQGMDYFSQVVATRRLYKQLETRSYRNFIISDNNLEKLIQEENIDVYIDFFRKYYISGDYTKSSQSTIEASKQTDNRIETAPKPVVEEEPAYQGAFKTAIEGNHRFIMLLPQTGYDKENLKRLILAFNQQNFASQSLQLNELSFDSQTVLLSISGLTSVDAAMQYLRTIVRNEEIYSPLMELNYRNFVISEDNYAIFLENKDISNYIEFYKAYYLKP
ncbi:type IX secretion system periplasmic lipoprotein PorW/SprE [Sunxiuqinia sp. A32]|uniref:type IX secretion system periplasmic lipoprotein PorW/SprE n=1 Tax=Sunxiuqinia sp. A32 TaxID=3461496 RepID=UPI0040457FF4